MVGKIGGFVGGESGKSEENGDREAWGLTRSNLAFGV